MRLNHYLRPLSLAFLAFISTSTYAMQAPQQEIASDNTLNEVKSSFFDEFLLSEQVKLSGYTKVYIQQPSVEFDKRWLREHRTKVSRNYKKNITERYGKLLREQIQKAFEEQGNYTFVDQIPTTDDVLIVSANISKLDIHGPDYNGFVRQFVIRAGDATLDVTLSSKDGKSLAKFKDHRQTFERGFLLRPELTTRGLNQRDFRLLMAKWSKNMVEHIAMN
ncbi:hypothetical protein [Agarilytica rhodophyticola]|uniref:hypothetical protein n=1 Tax=Agarilytica rhodophyticola TaxID=1737490 RepID=UPI000B3471B7|nr:hypothetical protein [Agarilytica rhodophyticola]